MKKIPVILLLAVLFCLTAVSASALHEQESRYFGDVNDDGVISADDARTILRTAVHLDTLEELDLFFADTDGDPGISASDARIALRAAVKLEPLQKLLHTHRFKEEKLSLHDCNLNDILCYTCEECGYEESELLPVTGHQWSDYLTVGGIHIRECTVCHKSDRGTCTSKKVMLTEPTCLLPGLSQTVCPVCGDIQIDNCVEAALGHDYRTEQYGSCTEPCYSVTTCSRCDYRYTSPVTAPRGHDLTGVAVDASGNEYPVCKYCGMSLIDCFNENVNKLKDPQQFKGTITAVTFTRTQTDCDDFDFGLLLNKTVEAIMMDSISPDKMTYNLPWENRVLSNSIFPIIREDKVSRITMDDVASVNMTRVNTVDAAQRLPDSYTVSVNGEDKTVDLTHYKQIKTGPADKISVQIVPETAVLVSAGSTQGGNTYRFTRNGKAFDGSEETALERFQGIHLSELCSRFPVSESGNAEDNTLVTMKLNATKITTTGKADWYFDSSTAAPIACVYDVTVKMDEDVGMTAIKVIDGTFAMHNTMTYTYVYLFNDYYPSK